MNWPRLNALGWAVVICSALALVGAGYAAGWLGDQHWRLFQ